MVLLSIFVLVKFLTTFFLLIPEANNIFFRKQSPARERVKNHLNRSAVEQRSRLII
jgi:hypothetical protein